MIVEPSDALTVIPAAILAGVAVFMLLFCALWDSSAPKRTRKKHKAPRTLLGVVSPPENRDDK